MGRLRTLTKAQLWELGLLLALLVVACLVLTSVLRQMSGPKLFATVTETDNAKKSGTQVAEKAAPAVVAKEVAEKIAEPERYSVEEAPLPDEVVQLIKSKKPEDVKYYNGKKYVYARTLKLRVTAYAPDPRCCWPYDGTTTASGLSVKTNGGNLVAADTSLIKMHSLVEVPGYAGGKAVPVLDRGGAIKGNKLDVLLPTFDMAKGWGVKTVDVKIYEPVKM